MRIGLALLVATVGLTGCMQVSEDFEAQTVGNGNFTVQPREFYKVIFQLNRDAAVQYIVTSSFVKPVTADAPAGILLPVAINAWLAPDHSCDDAGESDRVRYYAGSMARNGSFWTSVEANLPKGMHCLIIDNTGSIRDGANGRNPAPVNYTIIAKPQTGNDAPVLAENLVAPENEILVDWSINYATAENEVFTALAHLPATFQCCEARQERPGQRPLPPIGGADDFEFHFSHVNLTNVGMPFYGQLEATFGSYAEAFRRTVNLRDGESQTIYIDPSFSDTIKGLHAATPATFSITLTDSATGQVVYSDSQSYQILPLSYFAWYLDGDAVHFLSPVLVTPNSGFIDEVLVDAAARTPWGSIVGYQEIGGYSHDEVTQIQMAAVWDTLQERGFTYVNAPEAYSSSAAQKVKPPAEVYADQSGNCIESVLLLASILEATGMTVNIVFTLGHAYLGVDTWFDEPVLNALETTMLPTASFEDAYAVAANRYETDQHNQFFQLIDVKVARQYGINPNPWIT